GFAHLSEEGAVTWLAEPAAEGSRMNDAACDPQGRFWAGAVSPGLVPGKGAIHMLDTDGRVRCMLEGLTLPNGMGWSPDGSLFYLVDRADQTVWSFTFRGPDGALSAKRPLVRLGKEEGDPDGLTVDAQGDLWVAIYDGACVNHYAPDGRLRETLPLPAKQVTC